MGAQLLHHEAPRAAVARGVRPLPAAASKSPEIVALEKRIAALETALGNQVGFTRDASGALTLNAPNITIKATAAVNIEGGAMAKLQGGGQTQVTGGIVMIN